MFENNELCSLLNISYPIVQGGMAWASDFELAYAVSSSGGLGIIGCGGRQISWVEDQIEKIKRKNTPVQIGINVALNDTNAIEIIDYGVKQGIKVFTLGGSQTFLKLFSRYDRDVLIIPLVGSVMEAKLAERAGAKAIICEGQESGGSIGRLSLFSLLPQIVDSVKIPVIAAGGIADRRGMLAAFALGAKGIQMGTRFLASTESPVSQEYKNRIVRSKDTDSQVIFNKINFPARVLKNKFSMHYLSLEKKGADINQLLNLSRGRLKLATESNIDEGAIMAGEVSGLIREIKSVSQIFNELIQKN